MRVHLHWDVLFVLEQDDLRRAPDVKHYQLAQQLRRTLVTMDRDYLTIAAFRRSRAAACWSSTHPTSASSRRCSSGSTGCCFTAKSQRSPCRCRWSARKLQVNSDWGRN
jgi:hypothetical protein